MKNQIKLAISTAVAATILGSSAAFAGASANVAVTNDYIWRGESQSAQNAAVSGGLDYEFGNGLSVGTWVSNLADGSGYELDLYGAYGGKIGGADYSVGFTNYRYPTADDADFTEINGSLGLGPVSAAVAYTVSSDDDDSATFSKGDIYYSLGFSKEIKTDLSVGATLGKYDFDADAGEDYTHYQLNLSKGDFTFAVDDTDKDGSDPLVSVSWSHALDL